MNQNVGDTDVVVRYVLAVIFILTGFMFNQWLFIVAMYFVLSAFLGWCLFYAIFHINTCKPKDLITTSIPSTLTTTTTTPPSTTPSTPATTQVTTVTSVVTTQTAPSQTNIPTGDQIDHLAAEHSMPAPTSSPKSAPKKRAKPKAKKTAPVKKTVKKVAKKAPSKPAKKKKK